MKPELKFTRRMFALFGAPEVASVDEVIIEYTNALRGNTAEVLDRAADKIARERRIRAWPTVAECLDAVSEVKRHPNDAKLEPIGNFEEWIDMRLRRIETAENEQQIAAELALIEPYHLAKWIDPRHMATAKATADMRRRQWKKDGAAKLAQRVIGEGA